MAKGTVIDPHAVAVDEQLGLAAPARSGGSAPRPTEAPVGTATSDSTTWWSPKQL